MIYGAEMEKQRGLTLLEILIAMSLGAFMLVGIISLMATVSATRTELGRSSELIENGRYAIQILSEDIALGGYIGPYYSGNIIRTDPSPCDDDAPLSDLGVVYSATNPQLPSAISGFAEGATLPTCINNATPIADAEVLVVRHVNPESVAAASAVDGDPYFQFSNCDSEAQFVFSNVKANFTAPSGLTGNDCTTLQPVWAYESRAYFISQCDDCSGGGDGIPTLKAVEYASGTLNTISLVEGIEDMHLEYGMDLDGDGGPDCYIPDPAVDDLTTVGCPNAGAGPLPALDVENWDDVVAVKVNLLVRSLDEDPGWNDTQTYELGRAARVGPFNDAFKRRVQSTSVLIQNISGVRE
jgi:type IV pilus assembly protein PilW